MMKAHWTRATTPTGVVVVAVWLVVGTAFSCAAVAYQQEQREPYQELLLVPVEENQQPQQNGYDAQKQWLGNKNANVQFVRVDKNAPDHKSADLDDTDKQQKNDERLVFPRPQTNCQTRIVVQRWGPPVSPPTTTTTPLLYLLVKLVSNARIPPPLAFSAVPNGFSPQQRLYRSMDPIVTTTTALAAWHKTPATTRSTGSADDDDDGASSARKIPHQQTDRHPLAQQQHADDCHEHVDPTTTTAKQSSRSSSSWTYIYELLEPLHLELGGVGKKVQHVVDYAYTPAVMDHDFGDGGESLASSSHSRHTTVHNEDEDETHGVETTDNGHGSETSSDSSSGKGELEEPESIPRGFFHWRWWQWWMPWTTVQNERKKSERHSFSQDGEYDSSSSSYSGYYKLDPEAFAGGSHGQVWRGQRRRRKRSQRNGSEGQAFECDSDTLENDYNFEEEMEKEPLIFKRLKVNSGFRTLEAGLREVYFGNLLSQLNTKRPSSVDDKQSNSSSLLFTEYVEHFFGDESEGGELWIVFRDAGPSLRSFLYSSLDAGDYVVYQHSGLWSRMRMSLHAQDQQEPINEQQIHLDAVKSDDPLPDNQVDEAFGSELIRTVLRQVRFLKKETLFSLAIKICPNS